MDYIFHLGVLFTIYAISATALNFTFGLGGLFNLAHIAIFAVGAYTVAIGTTAFGLAPSVAITLAVFVALLFAIPLGVIANRIRSPDQFAIATLAFHEIFRAVALNWTSLTRGPLGIAAIPRPDFFGVNLYATENFLLWSGSFALVACGIILFFFESSSGRTLRAARESDVFTTALGGDPKQSRLLAFFVGTAGAGLAGAIFASYLNFVDPSSFLISELIFILTIVIVGRPGSFAGVIGATLLLVLLPEPLRFLDIPSEILAPTRQLLYSIILFTITLVRREKIFPIQRTI